MPAIKRKFTVAAAAHPHSTVYRSRLYTTLMTMQFFSLQSLCFLRVINNNILNGNTLEKVLCYGKHRMTYNHWKWGDRYLFRGEWSKRQALSRKSIPWRMQIMCDCLGVIVYYTWIRTRLGGGVREYKMDLNKYAEHQTHEKLHNVYKSVSFIWRLISVLFYTRDTIMGFCFRKLLCPLWRKGTEGVKSREWEYLRGYHSWVDHRS